MKKNIFLVTLLVGVLMGSEYLTAWTGPATSPSPTDAPNNNVPAPINVGTASQTKAGDLTVAGNVIVDALAAVNDVRSDSYCDALGANCFAPKASSLTPLNGYSWVGGLLFQWGRVCLSNNTTVSVNYPTAFDTAPLQIVGTLDTHNPSSNRGANFSLKLNTNSTFTAGWGSGVVGTCIDWLAVGH